MFLHRIIAIGSIPDTDWARTQADPTASILATGGRKLEASTSHGALYWWAIPYDGGDIDSLPTSGAGMTFDARVIYTRSPVYEGAPGRTVLGARRSPGEIIGSAQPIGREHMEVGLPGGTSGYLQAISVAGAPGPATHVWLFWSFDPRPGGR
jgi:hypothetical protein